MKLEYSGMLYKVYDKKIAGLVKSAVIDICDNKIKQVKEINDPERDQFEMLDTLLTSLFDIYLVLQSLAGYAAVLCPDLNDLQVPHYRDWFSSALVPWLDLSVQKALTRIERAAELDSLTPVDATVNYSSSSVDTISIFHQVRMFWEQLRLPNTEKTFEYVSKIIEDVCNCCDAYDRKMAQRAEALGVVQTETAKKFRVTPEWCVAINNIDYIRQSIRLFVEKLELEAIAKEVSETCGEEEANLWLENCEFDVTTATKKEEDKIVCLAKSLATKMTPAMRRLIDESSELSELGYQALDWMLNYMEYSLETLHRGLDENIFLIVLDAIWLNLLNLFEELVYVSLEKREPPSFFSNLRNILQMMAEDFKCPEIPKKSGEKMEQVDQLIELHSQETADLIHQYYKERHAIQEETEKSPYGLLTVRCCFRGNELEIEVMNAKNLIPMNRDGTTDPFVSIRFIPEDESIDVTHLKTQVHEKNLFPLFDETFKV